MPRPGTVLSAPVKRDILRYFLLACLLASSAFAAWAWLRPYDWSPDTAARGAIVESLLTRDQSYYWVDVRLKMNAGMTHDLRKEVVLETAAGKRLEPADTVLGGDDIHAPQEIWFKFWLEPADLAGRLTLWINDGKLAVRTSTGIPDLGDATYRNFTTHRW